MSYVKKPHTALFTGPTDCGKTKLVLDLIEKEYNKHFENIIILCPTLRWNKTYLERSWIWRNDYIFCINPQDKLFERIDKLSELFAEEETLFIVDDCIANENMDKKRQALLELAISGRHKKHSMWFLTQSYTAIPKNLRRQKKMVFVWDPSDTEDLKFIVRECKIKKLQTRISEIDELLEAHEYACLYVRMQFPKDFKVINL